MSEHRTQQLTGSEQLQRRITLANLAAGASTGLWLVPIALLFFDMPHDVFVLVLVVAGTISLSTLAIGITLRAQARQAQWRERIEEVSQRRHNDLTVQIAAENAAVQQLVATQLQDIRRRVDEVAGKVGRDYFGIYADALTDMHGGPEIVNGTETTKLEPYNNAANVVHFRRAANGGH